MALPASAQIEFELLDQRSIQSKGEYQGTRVGGISGIDYEPISDRWVMVSDARGEHAPTRAYEFGVILDGARIRKLQILAKLSMEHGDGTLFDALRYDPEAVRLRPARFFDGDDEGDPTMVWVSEGSRAHGLRPTIYEACMGATWMDQWEPPEYFLPGEKTGVRDNLGYESLALLPDGSVVAATEEPLAQDGPKVTAGVEGAPIRLVHHDMSDPFTPPTAQWVYELDAPPSEMGPLARNALVELEGVGNDTLLALERAYSPIAGVSTRLYLVEIEGASDVSDYESLEGETYTPVRKTLLTDVSDVKDRYGRPAPRANYEALALGPRLDDGRWLIVLASDNNFNDAEPTRFVFLAASGLNPDEPGVE